MPDFVILLPSVDRKTVAELLDIGCCHWTNLPINPVLCRCRGDDPGIVRLFAQMNADSLPVQSADVLAVG